MMKRSPFQIWISCSTALATWGALAAPAYAGPQGGSVVGGAATIANTPSKTTITQTTPNAIINWQSFNIAPGETTQFVQPSATSSTLNRVTGGGGASRINGSLLANGRVFIVNPDGILFGKGAQVNVGGLVATTNDIANSDFMAGNYKFNTPGNPSASVVNEGKITARNGGFAALVAPGVRNSGTVTANLGTVALGSGNAFTMDFYGDQLIKLQVSGDIASKVVDVATGQTMTSLVSNTGKLKANGGTVQMTAATARQVVDSVINNSGVIEANSVGAENGMIILGAETADTKTVNAPAQTVQVSGTLSAQGRKAGTSGGKIQITGEAITVTNAKLNASGKAGGGKILVGGDYGGGNPSSLAVKTYGQSLEASPVPTATSVSVDAMSSLNASATGSGNGGKVVVWSNQNTVFNGSANVSGGPSGGNGGLVETSGHTLNIDGATVTSAAAKGKSGHWLLDPEDFTVDANAAAAIDYALTTGDVVIASSAQGTSGNGDIIVNSPITWSTNSTLGFDAYRSLLINANITSTGPSADLSIAYNDGYNGGGFGGTLTTAQGASVTIGGSSSTLFINGYQYQLIHNQAELQNLALTGYSALANDISLSGVFLPIAGAQGLTTAFSGAFEGLGHNITSLQISYSGSSNSVGFLGLFGRASGATMENFNIVNASIQFSGFAEAGFLLGQGSAGIYNVNVSGDISGTSAFGAIGGIVGNFAYNANSAIYIVNSNSNININIDGTGVKGGFNVGGISGYNEGYIYNSSSTGNISVVSPSIYALINRPNLYATIGGISGTDYDYATSSGVFLSNSSISIQYKQMATSGYAYIGGLDGAVIYTTPTGTFSGSIIYSGCACVIGNSAAYSSLPFPPSLIFPSLSLPSTDPILILPITGSTLTLLTPSSALPTPPAPTPTPTPNPTPSPTPTPSPPPSPTPNPTPSTSPSSSPSSTPSSGADYSEETIHFATAQEFGLGPSDPLNLYTSNPFSPLQLDANGNIDWGIFAEVAPSMSLDDFARQTASDHAVIALKNKALQERINNIKSIGQSEMSKINSEDLSYSYVWSELVFSYEMGGLDFVDNKMYLVRDLAIQKFIDGVAGEIPYVKKIPDFGSYVIKGGRNIFVMAETQLEIFLATVSSNTGN